MKNTRVTTSARRTAARLHVTILLLRAKRAYLLSFPSPFEAENPRALTPEADHGTMLLDFDAPARNTTPSPIALPVPHEARSRVHWLVVTPQISAAPPLTLSNENISHTSISFFDVKTW
jgi:hypothetical protein